jgi:hypothetical protein
VSKPWFKPRTFGYGWSPAGWQGWLVTALWLVLSFGGVVWLIRHHHPGWIVPWVIAWVAALGVVIFLTTQSSAPPDD